MRQAPRTGVVQSLVPSVYGSAVVACVTNICQGSTNLLDLYRFRESGKKCFFHLFNQYISHPLLFCLIFFFIALPVVSFIFLPVIKALEYNDIKRVFPIRRIAFIQVIIKSKAKTGIFQFCIKCSLITGFYVIPCFVKDFGIFDTDFTNQILL